MPCSQMMSMNCSPPRAMAAMNPAALPAAKARMRNRPSWNIGSATRLSMTTNAISNRTPPMRPPRTHGLVQPIVWPP